ncbi:MAG: S41 family peptidase [Coprobacillus sp.]
MDNFEFENKKKKRLKREPLYIIACILCLIIGAGGGYFYSHVSNTSKQNEKVDISSQIQSVINDSFVDVTGLETTLQERMLSGMVSGLGDPYSSYLSQKEALELVDSINGNFVGIGISFIMLDNSALILECFKGTPAAETGLLAGDFITHVNGTSIAGYSSDKVKSVIQGTENTKATLKILRDGKEKTVDVMRKNVDTSASYEVKTSNNKKFGLLRINSFGEQTSQVVENAFKEFKTQGVEDLVIDLRSNGGGFLEAAKNILDLLVEKDKTLFTVQYKTGKKDAVYKATDREKYSFKNGYILVNGESASASEVTAAGLKDILGYKLIGTKTYGKGIVQTQKVLTDSSVLKYTEAKWLTPKGECVHEKGMEPDYEVKQKTLADFSYQTLKQSYKYDQVDNNIKIMQEMLKELGYKVDRTDGYFSKQTEIVLKEFEKDNQLKSDGIYEQNDSFVLLSVLTYHIYQEIDDSVYLKAIELIK